VSHGPRSAATSRPSYAHPWSPRIHAGRLSSALGQPVRDVKTMKNLGCLIVIFIATASLILSEHDLFRDLGLGVPSTLPPAFLTLGANPPGPTFGILWAYIYPTWLCVAAGVRGF